jgi:hypothetical protein
MRTARQIAEVVKTSDRAHECDAWQPPAMVNTPIANLPVFSDGILCEKDQFCQFIARSIGTMRYHWRNRHAWVAPVNHGGRQRQQGLSAAEQQIQQFTRVVRCQRAFSQGPASHYIRVRTLGAEAITGADSMPATEVGDRLIDEIELAFTEESELPHVIDASERDDAKA